MKSKTNYHNNKLTLKVSLQKPTVLETKWLEEDHNIQINWLHCKREWTQEEIIIIKSKIQTILIAFLKIKVDEESRKRVLHIALHHLLSLLPNRIKKVPSAKIKILSLLKKMNKLITYINSKLINSFSLLKNKYLYWKHMIKNQQVTNFIKVYLTH